MNEEQTTQLRKREEQRVADVGKALLSDDKFTDIEKKVAKLNESANADMLAALTDEQQHLCPDYWKLFETFMREHPAPKVAA